MLNGIKPVSISGTVLLLLASSLFADPGALAQVVRDTTQGQQNFGTIAPSAEGIILIDGADGIRRDDGRVILHSFEEFGLTSGETALYTDSLDLDTARNVISRITGSSPSQLDGRIESLYPNADLLFVNPNGVFFGSGFTVSVKQGFHVSTADFLEMRSTLDGTVTTIDTGSIQPVPTLVMAVPHAWGFMGAGPTEGGDIVVDGFGVIGVFNSIAPAENH